MKHNTKAVFAAFNRAVISGFAAAGIKPAGRLYWNEEIPEFVIATRAGTYRCHHGMNIDLEGSRPLNFLEVIGAFDEPERARKFVDCNPYNGKWNRQGIGYIATVAEAEELAKYIVARILSI